MTSWEGDDVGATARNRLLEMWGGMTRRQLWVIAGVAAVAGGLAQNWGWLTAIGAAPILFAILPCAAMCALGLCMVGRGPAGERGDGPPSAHTERPSSDGV